MDSAVIGQVGLVLGSIGAGLQWFRAFKGFPEWAYYVLACLATVGGCYLGMDASAPVNWRLFILTNWPLFMTLLGTTLGGTQAVSTGAKEVVKLGANPTHPFVPVTDSK